MCQCLSLIPVMCCSLPEDGEFEVTAEMLIHDDVDDEQTLVEAEAQESVAEVEEEVADLQQVLIVLVSCRDSSVEPVWARV